MRLDLLLETALVDLEFCERDPDYVVDMHFWVFKEQDVCRVCLAGAYLVQNHPYYIPDEGRSIDPGIDVLPQDIRQEMKALNAIRVGHYYHALDHLGERSMLSDKLEEQVGTFCSYAYNPVEFKDAIRKIIAIAKEHYAARETVGVS